MKRISLLAFCLAALGACAGKVSAPLRYVAVDMPASIPAASTQSASPASERIDAWRVGFSYRPAPEAATLLKTLQQRVQSSVLRDADLVLEVPFCVWGIVCFGVDGAFGKPSPALTPNHS